MNKLLKYNQAKYEILNVIAKYNLKVGDRLPSERTLEAQFPFSSISLRRALKELAEQGYIEKRHGSGTYLMKPIENWNKKGEMLFLEIVQKENPPPANVYEMKQFLRERNIDLKIMTYIKPDAEIANIARECIGVFISGWVNAEWLDFLKMLDIPFLVVGAQTFMDSVPTIDRDWQAATEIMTENLIGKGCRKIGLINGAEDYFPAHLIFRGFTSAMNKAGLSFDKNDILWKPPYTSRGPVHDFMDSGDYDAIVVESGATKHILIYGWEKHFKKLPVLGILGSFDDNLSSEKMVLLEFEKPVHIAAGEIFFESLNNPDYFKGGPVLVKPRIIPEAEEK